MAFTTLWAIQECDRLAALVVAKIGSSGSGFGDGDSTLVGTAKYGADRAAYDLQQDLLKANDPALSAALLTNVTALGSNAAYQAEIKSVLGQVMSDLNRQCSVLVATAANVDQLALSENNGTTAWNAMLLPPAWASLWLAFSGSPASLLNIYSPAIATMYTQVVGGSSTPGTNVDTTKYAGVAVSRATVTAISGSGVITVTGKNQGGVSHTWTTPSVSTNGTYDLTPGTTGDILTQVTGISGGTLAASTSIVISGDVPYYVNPLATFTVGGSLVQGTTSQVPWGLGAPVIVATGVTGSGVVTVSGVNQNGLGGRTWTCTVSANGLFTLTPGTGGDLLSSVYLVAAAGGLSAATLAVAAQRVNPPAA